MKPVMVFFALLAGVFSHANTIVQDSSSVCLNVPAYAELQMPAAINFEPLPQNEKGAAKQFRANNKLLLESNVSVQLVAVAPSVTNGVNAYTPTVFIDNKKDQAFLSYQAGVQTIDLRMDMNLPANEIQKAGEYNGELSVMVVADLELQSCP